MHTEQLHSTQWFYYSQQESKIVTRQIYDTETYPKPECKTQDYNDSVWMKDGWIKWTKSVFYSFTPVVLF